LPKRKEEDFQRTAKDLQSSPGGKRYPAGTSPHSKKLILCIRHRKRKRNKGAVTVKRRREKYGAAAINGRKESLFYLRRKIEFAARANS